MRREDKSIKMIELIEEIRSSTSALSIHSIRKGKLKDVSLINQFQFHSHIPNKWFDWVNTVNNSDIMIIGQDWGPYSVLNKYISSYDESKINDIEYNRDFMFKYFSSRTEKYILNTVKETYMERYNKEFTLDKWDRIFFTMAVLFTRQGKHFRGSDNFDEKKSFEISYSYVKKQIDIVKPKLIIPLGNLAFRVLNEYYNLGYKDIQVSKIIKNLATGIIKVNDVNILPNFHPASHISPKIQKDIWKKMWYVTNI